MQNFNDFGLPPIKTKQDADPEALACPRCQCAWFKQVTFGQYEAEHYVMIGQTVPPRIHSATVVMLECLECSNLITPTILRNQRDGASKSYDTFLDALDKKKMAQKIEDSSKVVKADKL